MRSCAAGQLLFYANMAMRSRHERLGQGHRKLGERRYRACKMLPGRFTWKMQPVPICFSACRSHGETEVCAGATAQTQMEAEWLSLRFLH